MEKYIGRTTLGILSIVLLLVLAPIASSEPAADQIAILANSNTQDSPVVAKHYASRRGVPDTNIIQVALPTQETISRKEYEKGLVQPVRRALEERRLAGKVRVLMTTYGIPLRISAPQPTDIEERWLKDALDRQTRARQILETVEDRLTRIASPEGQDTTPRTDSTPKGKNPDASAGGVDPRLERVAVEIRKAWERLSLVRDRGKAEEWTKEFLRITVLVGGTAALVKGLRPLPTTDSERSQAGLEKLRKQVASAQIMIRVLSEAPSETNRQTAYRLAEQVFGMQGVLTLAKEELETFSYKDGDASLDSELSLLWWDPGDYRIAERLPNPVYYGTSSAAVKLATPQPILPILMVSRLDAPTPQLAMQMVDQALLAEQTGLSGRAYIDARGMQAGPPYSYGFYDQNLRDLAGLLRRMTSYEVVLDDTERRFSRPGEAPEVAMYVGWYRLRSYEDAFTFNPGAIGYHMASGEAVSIHDPDEPGWCKNALERGITVTLGSTGEPLLDAFPLPGEFVGLLLSGRYALVEAYYLSTRYLSWRMVLFGDPLYNPWRGRGLVGGQAWKDGKAGLPTAPADLPLNDPIQARQQVKQLRETTLAQIDRFMEQLEDRSARDPASSLKQKP